MMEANEMGTFGVYTGEPLSVVLQHWGLSAESWGEEQQQVWDLNNPQLSKDTCRAGCSKGPV